MSLPMRRFGLVGILTFGVVEEDVVVLHDFGVAVEQPVGLLEECGKVRGLGGGDGAEFLFQEVARPDFLTLAEALLAALDEEFARELTGFAMHFFGEVVEALLDFAHFLFRVLLCLDCLASFPGDLGVATAPEEVSEGGVKLLGRQRHALDGLQTQAYRVMNWRGGLREAQFGELGREPLATALAAAEGATLAPEGAPAGKVACVLWADEDPHVEELAAFSHGPTDEPLPTSNPKTSPLKKSAFWLLGCIMVHLFRFAVACGVQREFMLNRDMAASGEVGR